MFIEERIKGNVEKFIKKYGTSDPEKIVKNMKNLDFAYEPLSENLNGYYLYLSEKRQIIRVNENLQDTLRQFTLFHELSHNVSKHKGKLLLNTTNISNIKEEYEADLCATYMFIVHNKITKENINEIKIPSRAKDLIDKFL